MNRILNIRRLAESSTEGVTIVNIGKSTQSADSVSGATSKLTPEMINRVLLDYGAGANTRVKKVRGLIAPTVTVPHLTGQYVKSGVQATLKIPDSRRALSTQGVTLEFDLFGGKYSCQPHALTLPVDAAEDTDAAWLLRDALDYFGEVTEQITEKEAIDKALAAAGAPVDMDWIDADPVAVIDRAIRELIPIAKSTEIAVVFGILAWEKFKASPDVKARGAAALSYSTCPNLFHTGARFDTAYSIHDTAPAGLEDIDFMFPQDDVLILASSERATRRDASALKSFSLDPKVLNPANVVPLKSGRGWLVTMDWAMDIQITNEPGIRRYRVK
ncbi:hypothetical protein DB345_17325 [Spartobacteria bacterium LR76]|nr:hypothetical protein DB345_17325 [Spartobacteria bacterium LR76]